MSGIDSSFLQDITATAACKTVTGTTIGLAIALVILIICFSCSLSSSFFARNKLCSYFSPCPTTGTATTTEAYKNVSKYGYIYN